MDRRTFIKTAASGSAALLLTQVASAADRIFPSKVDHELFDNINRVKDPRIKIGVEKGHVPVISAPSSVRAGEAFTVEVAVGEKLHPMTLTHWIEYIELRVGNEPAGRVDFPSNGFLNPKVAFTVVLSKEAAPEGKVTLIARQNCNLHGLWESSRDIEVV
jgi:superoxide reductase